MAQKPVDAVYSFQHLVDNIPQWKTSVTELSAHVAQRHAEYVAEYSRLLHKAKPRKQKSPSLCSVRSSDDNAARQSEEPTASVTTPDTSDYVEISPLEAGNRFLYAQVHRKRKPGNSLHSGASGPARFRNKQMAVIYYDAHIQTELDKLVKGFGAARNNLRKGRNTYTAARGFQLPSLGRRFEHLLPNSGRDASRYGRVKLPESKSDTTVETTANQATGDAAFNRADKELEAVQSICETAAHQVIRDGDCKLELDNTAKGLDTLYALAKVYLEEFIAEERKRIEEEEKQQQEQSPSLDGTSNESSRTTLCEDDSIEALNITNKGMPCLADALKGLKRPPMQSVSSAPATAPFLDAIEVDDDDDQSSIDIDISRFRMANPARRIRA